MFTYSFIVNDPNVDFSNTSSHSDWCVDENVNTILCKGVQANIGGINSKITTRMNESSTTISNKCNNFQDGIAGIYLNILYIYFIL